MSNPTLVKSLFCGISFLFLVSNSKEDKNGLSRESLRTLSAPDMPLNKNVRQFVSNYIRHNRQELYTIRQRSRSPFRLIDSIFSKYKLPVQLKYLAVIESELKSTAVSPVGAAGPWQLMPETAQILGLKISSACDERKQYAKSTKAAALYLKDLYAQFGDWLLVLAAYNGGPGPVYRAIHHSGSRNFWNLQAYLPRESRTHVKKFIAAHYYFERRSESNSTSALLLAAL